jgi:hypothetical protein
MKNIFINELINLFSEEKEKIEYIEQNLKGDFEKQLFNASINNLLDIYNPLRINNFSFAIRELIYYILEKRAPEEKIKKCLWYEPENKCNPKNKSNKPTRRQKIYYLFHQNFPEEFIKSASEEIYKNYKKIEEDLIKRLETLSKFTHIREKVFDISIEEQTKNVKETINVLYEIFKNIDKIKTLKDEFIQKISIPIFNEFISRHFDELDTLATHYYIEDVYIEDFDLVDKNDEHYFLKLEGNVSCQHQFGSDSDVRKGNGDIFSYSYPVKILITVDKNEPLNLEYFEIENIHIDTNNYFK